MVNVEVIVAKSWMSCPSSLLALFSLNEQVGSCAGKKLGLPPDGAPGGGGGSWVATAITAAWAAGCAGANTLSSKATITSGRANRLIRRMEFFPRVGGGHTLSRAE